MKNLIVVLAVAASATRCQEERVLGGWSAAPNSVCEEAWRNFSKNYFENHRVVGCTQQVVAGINYGITLENPDSPIPRCVLKVFRSIAREWEVLTHFEQDDGCIKLYRDTYGTE